MYLDIGMREDRPLAAELEAVPSFQAVVTNTVRFLILIHTDVSSIIINDFKFCSITQVLWFFCKASTGQNTRKITYKLTNIN